MFKKYFQNKVICIYETILTLEEKKDIYNDIKPNVIVNENLTLSNEESKLFKICKKNKNVKLLVDRLDLMEV